MKYKYLGIISGIVLLVTGLVYTSKDSEAQGVSAKVVAYIYDATGNAISLTNGLFVNVLNTFAGEDVANDVRKVEQRFAYRNIILAAPTTTVIKSGPGFLHLITVNKSTALGVIICYDNTVGSGPIIMTNTQPAAVLETQFTLHYDVAFTVGLTCVTSGAAQDITVSSR